MTKDDLPLKAFRYMQASDNTLRAGWLLRLRFRLFGEDVHDVDERGYKIYCKEYRGKLYLISYEAVK